jgi:hypothetical protein
MRPRPSRRTTFRSLVAPSSHSHTNWTHPYNAAKAKSASPHATPNGIKTNDLLLHTMLAPALAQIPIDDILASQSLSLAVVPAHTGAIPHPAQAGKRGPRGKADITHNGIGDGPSKDIPAAPGTLTALAIASGQQAPVSVGGKRAAGTGGHWVLGKSLAELKRMESASQLEIDSDWARMQGTLGRGRRARGE